MSAERQGHPKFVALSLACFAISVAAFSGLVLRSDVIGRIIFGVVWAATGVVWLGCCFGAFFGRE